MIEAYAGSGSQALSDGIVNEVTVTTPACSDGQLLLLILESGYIGYWGSPSGADIDGYTLIGYYNTGVGGPCITTLYARWADSEPADRTFPLEYVLGLGFGPAPAAVRATILVFDVELESGESFPIAGSPTGFPGWSSSLTGQAAFDSTRNPIGWTATGFNTTENDASWGTVLANFGTIDGTTTGGAYSPGDDSNLDGDLDNILGNEDLLAVQDQGGGTITQVRWFRIGMAENNGFFYTADVTAPTGNYDLSAVPPNWVFQMYVDASGGEVIPADEEHGVYVKRHVTARALPYYMNTGMLQGVPRHGADRR